MAEKLISVDRMETVLSLFGNYDENVNLIQKEYNVVILGRGDDIKITGDEENVFNASEAINSLIALINKGEAITEQTIRYVFTLFDHFLIKNSTSLQSSPYRVYVTVAVTPFSVTLSSTCRSFIS